MKVTQNERIITWFRRNPGIWLSPASGFHKFGTLKLSTRVGELVKEGWLANEERINSQYTTWPDGKTTKVYWYERT